MSNIAAVFQIGSLGDTIVSVPVLRSLTELLPECSEYLLVSRFDNAANVAPKHVFEMASKVRYRLDYHGMGTKLQRFHSASSLLGKLRFFRPRYCVYLMPADRSPKQVFRDRLFFKAGGVRELLGFRALSKNDYSPSAAYRNTEAFLRFRRVWNEQAEEKFQRYGAAPILAPDEDSRNHVSAWLETIGSSSEQPLVAVCPFSNFESRNWPSQSVVKLLRKLEGEGGVRTLLLGGEKDREAADSIIAEAGTGVNACGAMSPSESAALLQRCRLAICTESGPMHLAGALGIPTVTTFSRINSDLERWFPLGRNHTILYRSVPCAGCRLRVCPVEGHPCMVKITAEEVFLVTMRKLQGLCTSAEDVSESMNGTLLEHWNLPPVQC